MNQSKELVIIEDEADIAELMEFHLKKHGHTIHKFESGESGLSAIQNHLPDLVLLDLMLPGKDGLTICKEIKSSEKTKDLPVVMVTAKGEEEDIVKGLEMGADDYISKPFSPKVLVARVDAVLRRNPKKRHVASTLDVAGISMHAGKRKVEVLGKPIELTRTEFDVLQFLASHPGWVFTRSQLVKAVQGDHYAVTDRAVDVQMVGLRRKLGELGDCIETVRGVGYRFKELNS
ncbi:MAG: DNA-binding response regulator [Bdellovibrionaceae bacterium]|nr:DNA-binding response regulator [Pseudobdellovibrionaceae bacterium]